MEANVLYQQVKGTIDNFIIEYGDFMGIDYSPNYELQLTEVSQERADIYIERRKKVLKFQKI